MKKLLVLAGIFILGLSITTTAVAALPAKNVKQEATGNQKKDKEKMKAENQEMRKQAKVEAKKNSAIKTKADGTPDKRYKENKKLKSDGTPDKRFKENKTN